jgi:hypothetical protein
MRRTAWGLLFFCLLAVPVWLQAQSDVGGVVGTVTDTSGAVISTAKVELRDLSTNQALTTTTNAAGQYSFSRVQPSTYKITVTAPNFSAGVVNNLRVSIGKTAMANVSLQVGTVSQVVEVQAGMANELQTQDASIGSVIGARELANMPNLNRDATTLVLLQPGAMPTQAGDENYGGQIAGARSDQNTFMVDGGDVTNNTDALGSYAGTNNFSGVPHGAIPTPVESLEEFRVVTNNNISGFNRSAGAEVQMVTRRGTNNWHGAVYDYGIWDEANANTWALNHSKTAKPEWRDNRFGGRLGGPVFKDKTFFFFNVESRHFLKGSTVSRWVPTAAARAGQIGYLATDGTYKTVDVKTLDPLGLGINNDVQQIWNSMPLPNASGGDGVNFGTFVGSAPVSTNSEAAVVRVDHQISSNWHATASWRYGVEDNTTTNQALITSSKVQAYGKRPVFGNYLVGGLTGQITSHITNDFHFDFLRNYWQWGTRGDLPQLSGLGGALQLVNESVSSGVVPINVDTQQSRQRLWDGKDYNIIDNVSWMKGKHLFQIGGRFGWQRFLHLRNDKVTGGTTYPIYYSVWSSGTYNSIGGIPSPADMSSKFRTSYRTAYTAMLGMISQATQVLTRKGDLSPTTPGTWVTANSIVDNWQLSFSDAWRLTPSLTVSYGLTWGVQLPPYETGRRQTMEVDAATGQIYSVDQYLGNKAAAALQGQSWNPVIGFMPISKTTRKYPFDPDYTNLGPRAAVAWNPSISRDSWLGRIFGDRKTVIRAGWTRAFDRVNGVDIVMTPALGVGFADLGICKAPLAAGGCAGAAGSTPTTAFRIGVNGNSLTIPGLSTLNPPVIPGTVTGANTPYSAVDWHIDPRRQTGSTDMFDLSIQRELPANTLIEVGFIGRISRDLYQKIDLNQIPYMYTMGGQSFAAAFDAVQKTLVANGTPAVQPFFEAALGGVGSTYCTGYSSCTAAVVANEGGNISVRDAFDTFNDLEGNWVSGNGTFIHFNDQVGTLDTTVSRGAAHYAGMFVSLRKSSSHGLSGMFNYTLSKSLDTYGFNQDIIDVMMDAYNAKRAYGLSNFDRRQVVNGTATWELPFGRGHRWASSGILDKIAGGWSTSYIFTAGTGVPEYIYSGNACGVEYGDGGYYADCASLVPTKSGSWNMSRHNTTTVSNGYGSQSTSQNYPNAFSNAGSFASYDNFRLPYFSDTRRGNQNWMHGLGYWNLDFGLTKTTHITERLTTRFDLTMVNAFNHPNMSDPSTNIDSPATFGVLTGSANLPRYMQFGLRFDF